MQQTEKYGFNLIEGGDDFSPAPLNENMGKVEGELSALSQTVTAKADASIFNAKTAALETAVNAAQAKADEERVYVGSYVGDGNTSRVITLPWTPKFMILVGYVSDEEGVYIIVHNHAFVISRYPGTCDIYGPYLQGGELRFRGTPTWGNNSEKTMWYIMFR